MADRNVSSKVLLFQKTGRVISKVDLFINIGISISSIKLNSFK